MKSVDKQRFSLELTTQEIGILKAALEYYKLEDEYGCILWEMRMNIRMCKHHQHDIWVSEVSHRLNELFPIKPDFGSFGDLDRLTELYNAGHSKEKRGYRNTRRFLSNLAKEGF